MTSPRLYTRPTRLEADRNARPDAGRCLSGYPPAALSAPLGGRESCGGRDRDRTPPLRSPAVVLRPPTTPASAARHTLIARSPPVTSPRGCAHDDGRSP